MLFVEQTRRQVFLLVREHQLFRIDGLLDRLRFLVGCLALLFSVLWLQVFTGWLLTVFLLRFVFVFVFVLVPVSIVMCCLLFIILVQV